MYTRMERSAGAGHRAGEAGRVLKVNFAINRKTRGVGVYNMIDRPEGAVGALRWAYCAGKSRTKEAIILYQEIRKMLPDDVGSEQVECLIDLVPAPKLMADGH
jgi:hypothetical protein